jgi:hypothetical protein
MDYYGFGFGWLLDIWGWICFWEGSMERRVNDGRIFMVGFKVFGIWMAG